MPFALYFESKKKFSPSRPQYKPNGPVQSRRDRSASVSDLQFAVPPFKLWKRIYSSLKSPSQLQVRSGCFYFAAVATSGAGARQADATAGPDWPERGTGAHSSPAWSIATPCYCAPMLEICVERSLLRMRAAVRREARVFARCLRPPRRTRQTGLSDAAGRVDGRIGFSTGKDVKLCLSVLGRRRCGHHSSPAMRTHVQWNEGKSLDMHSQDVVALIIFIRSYHSEAGLRDGSTPFVFPCLSKDHVSPQSSGGGLVLLKMA